MAKKSTRSAQGSGTIRQRPNGKWEARFTVGRDPGTGKQIQKSIYGDSQKEVRQKMQRILVEVDEGTYNAPSKLSLREWLDIWLNEYTGDIKPTSRLSYRQHINNHIAPALGAVKLTGLTPVAVQKFYNTLQKGEKQLSPKTIKNVHGVLHQALKQAVKLGYIRSNPTDACTLPRIEKQEIKPLDAPEIRQLLAALDDSTISTLIRVDLFTGLREGEILGLQWDCVDFERGIITVNKQLSRPRTKGDVYRFTSLKNDKPRVIQPAPYVMQLLKDHRMKQLQQRMLVGSLWDDHGFPNLVFTTETGKHICYEIVLRKYQAALAAAGLPKKRFHDLRHTYAVNSLRAGDDVKTVQENLGHHAAAFTLDQYGHVTDTMRQASAQRMEAFISNLK